MKTRLPFILLGLAALVLLGPTPGHTQMPGYGYQGGGIQVQLGGPDGAQFKGGAPVVLQMPGGAAGGMYQAQGGGPGGFQMGRGGGQRDPNQFFDMLSQGANVIDLNNLDPRMLNRFGPYLQQVGATNGKITREQFAQAMQLRSQNGGGGSPQGGPGPQQGVSGQQTPQDIDAQALARFQRADKNGDGLLNSDEMPQALRDELNIWDKNHDGFIDLQEYKDWFKARQAARDAQRAQNGQDVNPYDPANPYNNGNQWQGQQWPGQYPQMPNLPADEEAKRPVVYHAGNLPRDIPAWFTQADSNQDGQVSLYEWRSFGWSDRDFFAIDANGDGFITVEEAMRNQARQRASTDVAGTQAPGGPGFGMMGGGPNGMGGGGFPNMGGMGGFPNMGNRGQGGGGRGNRGPGGMGGGGNWPPGGNYMPGGQTMTPSAIPGASDGSFDIRSFYRGADQQGQGGNGRRNRGGQ